ncbi:VanZ family protein [Tuberibacillus sp. Marseille-P3662]|uniref:VanZ family protein n=1 Tax=Tuberibacillus sp. Marseille-P3662 TaxID=1965358 RepID=UPI000A1CC5A4|nr:VanZ family protein [Tuberibacillus sp. Marseille-P3662]
MQEVAQAPIIRKRIKRFAACIFFTYIAILLYLTLFTYNYYVYGKSVNLVVFDSIKLMLDSGNPWLMIKNILGNVALFVPFGLLVPLIFKSVRPFIISFIIAFGSSLLIEAMQFEFAKRIFDIDDILLNTIGAVLGWILFKILYGLYRLVFYVIYHR